MWYDGVKIISAGGFRNSSASIKAVALQVDASYGSNDTWFDDHQIGEPDGWSGTFLGVTNPPMINGNVKANVSEVNGEAST